MKFDDQKEMIEKLTKKAHAHLMDKRPCIPHVMNVKEYALYIFDAECYDISYSGAEPGMVSIESVTAAMNSLGLSYSYGGDIENSAQVKLMKIYKTPEEADNG